MSRVVVALLSFVVVVAFELAAVAAAAVVFSGCAFHSEPWPELGPELERDRAVRLLDAAGDDDAGELEQLDAAALGDGSVAGGGAAGDAAAAAGSSSSSGMGGGAAGAAAAAGAGGMGGNAGAAGECWAGPWPCVRGSMPDCMCVGL